MSNAYWIWNYGDFEIYHHALLSGRREEHGRIFPCFWPICRPSCNVVFRKQITIPQDTTLHLYTHSKGFFSLNGEKKAVNTDVAVEKGDYLMIVNLFNAEAFPSFFLDNEFVKSDETWLVDEYDDNIKFAGANDMFCSPECDPAVFPFSYKPLNAAFKTAVNGGILYDFGKELFGRVTVGELEKDDEVLLSYGESVEEATDCAYAIISETLTCADAKVRPSRGFRYIFVKSKLQKDIEITAEYEYLPIKDIAEFSCDDPDIKNIWDVCSHTFHLNSREFYLDGIKRDRWVWGGDAYQSFMVNRYLYFEPDITRRTITALLGRPPYRTHINKINDYSAYIIMAVWEHYFATGDIKFVQSNWDNLCSLYGFITSRTDEKGYVVARTGDWIFIDWGDIDKDGTLCAEQILLWSVHKSMGKMAALLGKEDIYTGKATALKESILHDFWDEEKGAFIDCYDNQNHHISRQSNVLAVICDFADERTKLKIAQNVLHNNTIPPITTPYFKLYEMMALGEVGDFAAVQEHIKGYWGSLLKLGATSIWEEYDPQRNGTEHYEMYGERYGKSLCHAWGSGPVYLLGRYCCGVYPTDVGYKTFNVKPSFGIYKNINATVPVKGGSVKLNYCEGTLRVLSNVEGGTLCLSENKYALEKDVPFEIDIM